MTFLFSKKFYSVKILLMVLKRKLVLVNQTQYNVYVFTVLALGLLACLVVAGVLIPETRTSLATNLLFVFGLAVRYIKFKGYLPKTEDTDLSSEEEDELARSMPKLIPQKSLENIIRKISPPNSKEITPANSNDALENPNPESESTPSIITSSENE